MRTFYCFVVAVVFPALPLFLPVAHAAIYRCVQPDGLVSYQRIRCHGEDKPITLKDRRSGYSTLRPGEWALLDRYRKRDAARLRKLSSSRKKPSKESPACWKRRKQLEAIRAKLRHGYNLGEGEKLQRKRDDHEDYLQQFCS